MKSCRAPSNAQLKRLQGRIPRRNIDAFFVHTIRNVRYLAGFTGSSAFVMVTRNRGLFCTDFRYLEQAEREVRGWEFVNESGDRIAVIADLIKRLGIRRLGFETTLGYGFYEKLARVVPALIPQHNLVEEMRQVKSADELNDIVEAIRRAERALMSVRQRVRPGARETEIALRLERALREEGCRSVPFEIIVASGENASMPHAKPTGRKIGRGEFVIIDWGGEANGYYSDMTRTFLVGGASRRNLALYNLVNRARRKAVASVRHGVVARDIDEAARGVIRGAGYADAFGHGTGHGVGLDVHEAPRISWTNPARVRRGMVFTIEPGVYIPGVGGVRIEDMVLVRDDDAEVLTRLDREPVIEL